MSQCTSDCSVECFLIIMNLLVVLIVVTFTVEGADRVCYPHLGCFSMKAPWLSKDRPVPAPDPPETLKIRAFFFNKDQPRDPVVLSTWPKINIRDAMFDPNKRTFFINHGYATAGDYPWIKHMTLALLNRYDANIFVGDWGGGAINVDYFQAAGNLRMAARQFSNLIHYLIDQKGLNVSTLHLIGHSLGAQMCGYIGKTIPGIHRITALDPAQPCFEGFGPKVQLIKTDANFVDAIHADARPTVPDFGFGFMNPVGDIDYYMNGGRSQPGCKFPKLPKVPTIHGLTGFLAIPQQVMIDTLLCPHGLSHEFFIEAISNSECVFWGHNATIKNMLRGISNAASEGFFSKLIGISDICTYSSCSPMGMESFDFPARGSFVIITRGDYPHCILESQIVNLDDQERFAIKFEKWFFNFVKP